MIISFSVKNFGCIKDKVTLSFEATNSSELEEYYIVEPKKGLRLLKLGLIYGPNASGKTTILQALDFLRNIVLHPFSKKTDTFKFKPFLFDRESLQEHTFFTLEFIQNKIKYLYEVELNTEAVIEEKLYFYKPIKALVYKRNTKVEKQLSNIKYGSKIKLNGFQQISLEGNTLWNNTVLGGYLKTNLEFKELEDCLNWFNSALETLITTKSNLLDYITRKINSNIIDENRLINFLNKADFNIKQFVISKERREIDIEFDKVADEDFFDRLLKLLNTDIEINRVFFLHLLENDYKASGMLSYEEQSQGTQRYFQFAGLLDLLIRKKIILSIDEIESSLHPDLLEHFLLTFLVNSKESQIIATTHQRELLMKKDILRKDAIWFTEKKPNGSTDLYSLADFDSSVVRGTTSIYNAYKIGKLGAKPNLGDYYIETTNGEKK